MATSTEKAKAEKRLCFAALRRYRAWVAEYPRLNKAIVAGSNEGTGGKLAADMVRACAALAKLRKR